MGNMAFVESAIEKKLKDLHCGYIGKVISTDGNTAKVQPLGLIKETGSTATKTQAVVSDVPVACKYKFKAQSISYVTGASVEGGENIKAGDLTTARTTVAVPVPIAAGDLVVCLCADRNIEAARRGKNELPPAGYHSISDSIIVGIL